MKDQFRNLQTSMKLQKHLSAVGRVMAVVCLVAWCNMVFLLDFYIDPSKNELRDIPLVLITIFFVIIPYLFWKMYEPFLLYYPKLSKWATKRKEDIAFGWSVNLDRWYFNLGPKSLSSRCGIYTEIPEQIVPEHLKKSLLLTVVDKNDFLELEITETVTEFEFNGKKLFFLT